MPARPLGETHPWSEGGSDTRSVISTTHPGKSHHRGGPAPDTRTHHAGGNASTPVTWSARLIERVGRRRRTASNVPGTLRKFPLRPPKPMSRRRRPGGSPELGIAWENPVCVARRDRLGL